MHSTNIWKFKSINLLALVFLRSHKFSEFGDSQETSQPIPFVVISNEETRITVSNLITRSAKHDLSKRQPNSRSKARQIHRIFGFIRRLLAAQLLKLGRKRHIDNLSLRIPQQMHALLDRLLRQQRRMDRVVRFALGLAHVVAQR